MTRKHFRKYGSTKIEVWVDEQSGKIERAKLTQPDDAPPEAADHLGMGPHVLYGLIDTVAALDPDTWARRFPKE